MVTTDRKRLLVHARLESLLGAESADYIMEMIPIQPTSELATRSDLQANTIALRGEMATLAADLRGEMATLAADLRGEMAELRTDLRNEMAELRSEVRKEIAGLQRWGAGVIAANAITVITVLLT